MDIQDLNKLHPAVACVLVISVAGTICFALYQIWKTIRQQQL